MAVLGDLVAATRNPELSKDLLDLLSAYSEDIMGGKQDGESSDEQRYNQVFGTVGPTDVEALNAYLDQRTTLNKQTGESRQVAMDALQAELSKRFKQRISGYDG